DLDEIFQLNQIPVGVGESELLVEVCIPDCPPIRDAPFIVDLIAADNACPLPQLDTLRMMIQVQPPPNDFPVPSITDQTIVGQENVPFMPIPISATDVDTDSMTMKLVIAGLEDPSVYGFGLTVNTSVPGSIQADFTWNTDCLVSDFSELQNFKVGILIEDIDTCLVPNPDTLFFDAQIILPPNENPEVSSSISIPDEIELGNLLSFDVTVSDSDGDDVSLQLVGGNFDLPTYGITFPDASGNTTASSPFSWDLACSAQLYEDGQEFELWFIGDDADKCKVKNFDTLKSVIQVNYPPNLQPEFDPVDRIQTLRVNEVARVPIEAFDIDRDEITLSFAQGVRQPSQDIIFEPATGIGRVRSVLEWQPDCSLLRFGETRTLQDVVLQVVDDACPIRSIDTLKITFEIIDDSELQKTFLPPNVFTPNGDGVNDVFTLSGNADLNQNLPADNCGNVFEYIVINNRAGNTVFRSSSRDFVWSGGQFPSGVYYYLVKFTNSEFKGYIHLLK
ncbi:MAG: gliding motility-associated C-terminal domain-containing protein, partial [Bacteroidota bacterium]